MAEFKEYFSLPELPYDAAALEPYIDAETMKIHHGKHHKAYVDNLNKALSEQNVKDGITIEDILKNIKSYPAAVRNNGGGHYNHTLFWSIMGRSCGGDPTPELMIAMDKAFGSLEGFKTRFEEAAIKRFGSGWVWMVLKDNNELAIGSTPNQDCPLMPDAEITGYPLIGLDVWEHAYYLKYQNRRPDYVSGFWNLLDWNQVDARYNKACSLLGVAQNR